jgi:hypothetical protein
LAGSVPDGQGSTRKRVAGRGIKTGSGGRDRWRADRIPEMDTARERKKEKGRR